LQECDVLMVLRLPVPKLGTRKLTEKAGWLGSADHPASCRGLRGIAQRKRERPGPHEKKRVKNLKRLS
jgi:hypothetical protein